MFLVKLYGFIGMFCTMCFFVDKFLTFLDNRKRWRLEAQPTALMARLWQDLENHGLA